MKSGLRDLLTYARHITRKWVFWIFAALDLVALIAQLLYPAFRLPQLAFFLIILVGFFWAGYQVYRDIAAQLPSRPIKPFPYELLPLSFNVVLGQEIPWIEVWFYAVNHQSRELVLQSLDVMSFHLSSGPSLDKISLSRETCVAPRQSRRVLCRRHLIEAEVHAIERTHRRNPANATFSVTTRALVGRKHLHYETGSLSINGRV
jgi:hypothetical protein